MKQRFHGATRQVAARVFLARLRAKRSHIVLLDIELRGDAPMIQAKRTQDRDLVAEPCEETTPVVISRTRRRILLDGEIILSWREHGQSPRIGGCLIQPRCTSNLIFDRV
jgi:hypothetical protein